MSCARLIFWGGRGLIICVNEGLFVVRLFLNCGSNLSLAKREPSKNDNEKVKENLIQVFARAQQTTRGQNLVWYLSVFGLKKLQRSLERSFFASFRIEVDQRTVTLTFKQLCLSIYKSSNGQKPSKRKSCDVFISNVYDTWTLPRKLSNRKRFRHHHGACFALLVTQRFLWRKKRHLNLLPAWQ